MQSNVSAVNVVPSHGSHQYGAHISAPERGVGVVESMAASGLSKKPSHAGAFSPRRPQPWASASEPLESSSPSSTTGSCTLH
jgi:hypothetical protein